LLEIFPMTNFFHYDNLTWPEVADLPRDVPSFCLLVPPLIPRKSPRNWAIPTASAFFHPFPSAGAAGMNRGAKATCSVRGSPSDCWRVAFTSETFVGIAPTFNVGGGSQTMTSG
jgi:hypothetical protein